MKILFASILVLTMFLSLTAPVFAFGSVGGDDCGGCALLGLPESIEEQAKQLRTDYLRFSFQELLDQQILETLCENSDCGELSEQVASRLLDRKITVDNEINDASDRIEAKWTTRIGVLFTAFGLIVAWLAYKQSREADRRSVRNEVEIQHLRQSDT